MRLLEADQSFLAEKGYAHEVTEEGGMLCVILHGFPMPEAYSVRSVDLLLRLFTWSLLHFWRHTHIHDLMHSCYSRTEHACA